MIEYLVLNSICLFLILFFTKDHYIDQDKKIKVPYKKFWRKVNKSKNIVLGLDLAKKWVVIKFKSLSKHILCTGTSGAGKTKSVLLPISYQTIKSGKPLIFIDNKGDEEIRDYLYHYCKVNGREKDFLYYSLSEPDISNSYSALANGDEVSLTDLCMGSFSWGSERHYLNRAELHLALIFEGLKKSGKLFTWETIHDIIAYKEYYKQFVGRVEDELLKKKLKLVLSTWPTFEKECSTLLANVSKLCRTKYAKINNDARPDINLYDVILNNKVVLFSLNSMTFGETSKSVSKMVLQDLKGLVGYLNANKSKKKIMPIIIDEFHNSVYSGFIELIAQCRSAKIGLILATQTTSDLDNVEPFSIKDQVMQNTNTKILMKQNTPEQAEESANLTGTRTTQILTQQVETGVVMKGLDSEMGSLREGEKFNVHPNKFKEFKTGDAVLRYNDFNYLMKFGYQKEIKSLKEFKGNRYNMAAEMKSFLGYDKKFFKFNKVADISDPRKGSPKKILRKTTKANDAPKDGI